MCEAVITRILIFFLHYLQLRSTETFYEFSITKVYSFQKKQEHLNFDSKSTSFKPKTFEQMKNRYAFKLYPENDTRLNRTESTQFFFYKAYEWCFKDKYTWGTCYFFVVLFSIIYFTDNFFPDTLQLIILLLLIGMSVLLCSKICSYQKAYRT